MADQDISSVWEFLSAIYDPRDWRLGKLEKSADRLAQAAETSDDRLRAMELRLNQLSLFAGALWELMKTKTGLSEADMMRMVDEVYRTRLATPGSQAHASCPACGHKVSAAAPRCIYCGVRLMPPGGG